ncbi:MAG: GNAT family N-acetyltransferase [Myxococcota bacterium]
MAAPVLETRRLRLEPVELRHAPDLQRHFNDWEIIRNLATSVPWPYPDNGVVTFFEGNLLPRIANGTTYAWALVLRDTNEGIGLLEWRFDDGPAGHRGFWIGRAHQRQGLMTEAVTALQDYAFIECGFERMVVLNAAVNTASRRIKEKTGARLLDTVELPHHSGASETQRWEITREGWIAFRAQDKS